MDDLEKRAAARRRALENIKALEEGDLARPDLERAVAAATQKPDEEIDDPAQTAVSGIENRPNATMDDTRSFKGALEHQEGAAVPVSELYSAYSGWIRARGKNPIELEQFVKQLEASGLQSTRVAGRQRIVGVQVPTGLLDDAISVDAEARTRAKALESSLGTEHSERIIRVMQQHGLDDVQKLEGQMLLLAQRIQNAQQAATNVTDDAEKRRLFDEALQGTAFAEIATELKGTAPEDVVRTILRGAARQGEVPSNIARHKKTGKFGDLAIRFPIIGKGGELLTSLMNIGPVTAGVVTTALSYGYTNIPPNYVFATVTALIAADLMTKSGLRGAIADTGSVGRGTLRFYRTQPLRAALYSLASAAVIYGSGKAAMRADFDTGSNADSAGVVAQSAERLRGPLTESAKVMDKFIVAIDQLGKAVPGIECGLDMSTALSAIKETGIQVEAGKREGQPTCGPRGAQKFYIFHGTVDHAAIRQVLGSNVTIAASVRPAAVEQLQAPRKALGLVEGQTVAEKVRAIWTGYLTDTKTLREEAFNIIGELGRTQTSLGGRTFTQNMAATIIQPYHDLGAYLQELTNLSDARRSEQLKVEDAARRTLEILGKEHQADPHYQELLRRLGIPAEAPLPSADAEPNTQDLAKRHELTLKVRTLFQQIINTFQDSDLAKKYMETIDEWSRSILGDQSASGVIDARFIQQRADRLATIFTTLNAKYAATKSEIDTIAKGVERMLKTIDRGVATEAPEFALPAVNISSAALPSQSIFLSAEEMASYRKKHGDALAYSRIAGAFAIAGLINFLFLLSTLGALAATGRRSKREVDEMLPKLVESAHVRTTALSEAVNALMVPFIQTKTGAAGIRLTDPQQLQYMLRARARELGDAHIAGIRVTDRLNAAPRPGHEFTQALVDTLAFWQVETASSVIRANLWAEAVRGIEKDKGLNILLDRIMPDGTKWVSGQLREEDQNRIVARAMADRARFLELRQACVDTLKKELTRDTHIPPGLKSAMATRLEDQRATDAKEIHTIRVAMLSKLPAYDTWYTSENATRSQDRARSSNSVRTAAARSNVRSVAREGDTASIAISVDSLIPDIGLMQELFADALEHASKQLPSNP